jgi:hypothetical protein
MKTKCKNCGKTIDVRYSTHIGTTREQEGFYHWFNCDCNATVVFINNFETLQPLKKYNIDKDTYKDEYILKICYVIDRKPLYFTKVISKDSYKTKSELLTAFRIFKYQINSEIKILKQKANFDIQ